MPEPLTDAVDDKSRSVLDAVRRKTRPYTDADIARAAKLSKPVVRRRLRVLLDAGLVRERWVGDRGPYYETKGDDRDAR